MQELVELSAEDRGLAMSRFHPLTSASPTGQTTARRRGRSGDFPVAFAPVPPSRASGTVPPNVAPFERGNRGARRILSPGDFRDGYQLRQALDDST